MEKVPTVLYDRKKVTCPEHAHFVNYQFPSVASIALSESKPDGAGTSTRGRDIRQ
jgi:hypothetical protein